MLYHLAKHAERLKSKTEPSATKTATVSEAFEKVKALAGEWEAPYDGKIMKDTFRVVSDGSAVLHTESWNGSTQGAVSVIYPNGNELWLDHYCDLENQPRFSARPQANTDVIVFELRDITNLRSPDAEYFHRGTFHFIDYDHHIQTGNGSRTESRRKYCGWISNGSIRSIPPTDRPLDS
jgi:hypothetical protein